MDHVEFLQVLFILLLFQENGFVRLSCTFWALAHYLLWFMLQIKAKVLLMVDGARADV